MVSETEFAVIALIATLTVVISIYVWGYANSGPSYSWRVTDPRTCFDSAVKYNMTPDFATGFCNPYKLGKGAFPPMVPAN